MNGVIIKDSELAFSNKGMRATVPYEAAEYDLMEASKKIWIQTVDLYKLRADKRDCHLSLTW